MSVETKKYLDYNGLVEYDELIKAFIQDADNNQANKITALQAIVDVINGDVDTDGSIKKQIQDAVNDIIANAPETFDTLKEIANWLANDENKTAADIISSISNLNTYIDEKDTYLESKIDDVYASMNSINADDIKLLFLVAVTLAEGQTVAEALSTLTENQKLVIDKSTHAEITEDISLPANVVIEANGVVFSGNITIPKDAKITVIGATFTKPVIVA